MEKVLKSVVLEYERSSFLLELVKLNDNFQFIEVKQKIYSDDDKQANRVIKINPSVIDELIGALKSLQSEVPNKQLKIKHKLSEKEEKEIENRYLKGVPIKDLTLQFNCSETYIAKLLTNRGIELAPNVIPKWLKARKNKKK